MRQLLSFRFSSSFQENEKILFFYCQLFLTGILETNFLGF